MTLDPHDLNSLKKMKDSAGIYQKVINQEFLNNILFLDILSLDLYQTHLYIEYISYNSLLDEIW